MFETNAARFVLASGSKTRAELLENTGLSFAIAPARIDEPAIRSVFEQEETDPADVAEILAEAKAVEVSKAHSDHIVIGCDQVLALGDEIFAKPKTKDEAYAHLFKLRGKTHRLISSIVLVKNQGVIWRHSDTAELTMREFSPEFLGQYMSLCGDRIFQTPGSYQLESVGVHLFSEIKGDYFSILGFPLLPLLAHLRKEGFING